jgi:hypothetical protein
MIPMVACVVWLFEQQLASQTNDNGDVEEEFDCFCGSLMLLLCYYRRNRTCCGSVNSNSGNKKGIPYIHER